MVKPMS